MIVDQDLAARIERAEADFIVACSAAVGTRTGAAAFQQPVAGGFATYAGADSPFTKVVGTGFAAPPSDDELDLVEERYAGTGAPVGFEIASLADPGIHELLTRRGYLLVGFEDVLVCDLAGRGSSRSNGIDVAVTTDMAVWFDTAVASALHPDTARVAQLETFPRAALETAERAGIDAGAVPYLATVDSRPAGAGSIRIAGELAQLTGAGTLPDFRRRGVQQEMVRVRLDHAAAAGCRYAVVTTQPGSTSQANMRRAGFELGYTRAVLSRAPAPAPR